MHPACALTALCDRDAQKLASVAASWPQAARYEHAEALIDDSSVAIVVVASNDDDHHRQVVWALRAGKHVFCEKPLCLTSVELDEIQNAWRGSGRRLTTNTVLRRSPRFRWVHNAAREGRFGQILAIEADYVYGRFHKLTEGWRGRIPGYSVMLGGGIHLVDLVLWIAGERPVQVQALSSDLGSRGTAFTGRDLTIALLEFESGVVARVGANFASVHPHFHKLAVYGTKATFENTSPESARLWTDCGADMPAQVIDVPYPGVCKGDLVPAFVDAVLGQGEPDVTENEVFAAVAVCLAIDQSAAAGRPIVVSYR